MLAPANTSLPAIVNGCRSGSRIALGDRDRLARSAGVLEQHRELVAAEPGGGVAVAQARQRGAR